MSPKILVNGDITISLTIEQISSFIRRFELFKDLYQEYDDIDTIPINFECTNTVKNYLLNNYEDIDNPNVLIKYLKFAYFLRDIDNISILSCKIVENIEKLDIEANVTEDINLALIEALPKINATEYLFYKYAKVRKHTRLTSILEYSILDIDFLNTLIYKYEDKLLENTYELLSKNKNIPLEFIEQNLDKGWNWGADGLSHNPAVYPDFVEKYIDIPWHWGYAGFSDNKSMAIPYFVEQYIDKPWKWGNEELERISDGISYREYLIDNKIIKIRYYPNGLSYTMTITYDFFVKYIDKPWNWKELSKNDSIDVKIVEEYNNYSWNWNNLSKNPAIKPEFVDKHINYPWKWGTWGLSSNPSITPEFIEKHLNESWDWEKSVLSRNPAINSSFVEKYSNKPWSVNELLYNPSIPLNFTKKYIRSFDDGIMHKISGSPNVTIDFLKEHPEVLGYNNHYYTVDWYRMNNNPNITVEFIEKHLHTLWNYAELHIQYKTFKSLEEYMNYLNIKSEFKLS